MEDNQALYNRKPVPKSQKEISNGFVINSKFHIGYSGNRWRVLGKNKWYFCPSPEKFVKKYILKESV